MFNMGLPFWVRFFADEVNSESVDGGGVQVQQDNNTVDSNAAGFPADTPLAEMTDAQQAAYWRDKSRKHEKRARPANFDEIVEKARLWDKSQQEAKPERERELDNVRLEGKRAGIREFLPHAVKAELKAARPNLSDEDLSDLVENMNLDKFILEDGGLDTDRVKRVADKLAGTGDMPGNGSENVLGRVVAKTSAPREKSKSVADYEAEELARYKAS